MVNLWFSGVTVYSYIPLGVFGNCAMQIHIPTVNHFPLEMNGAGRNISICPNFSLLINSYLSGTNADLLNWQRMQIATRPPT